MATYAPVSSVVVSGADRNYDGIPDALQGSRRILTNGDVSPRRIVERDLSPNRTITRVISPTYAPTSPVVVSGVDRNYDGIPDALQGSRVILTNGDVSPSRIVERDLSPDALQGGRVVYQAPAVRSCEWMFGDAANGLCGLHSMVGLNPLRWSGTVSIDKAIQQITEVQRHNDRPISLNVLPNDFSARQHAFPTTQQALNYLLFLQKPEVQYVQEAAPQVQYIQQAPQVQYIQQEAAPTMTYAAPQVQYVQEAAPQVQYIQQAPAPTYVYGS